MYQPVDQNDFLSADMSGGKLNEGGLSSKMDNPIWYVSKVCFVYVLVFVDIFLNSEVGSGSIDQMKGGIRTFWPFLFLVGQTSVQLFIFLTLFLLMCNTYMMRIGLPGVIISDFKFLGIAQLVYLTFTVILGMMRILFFESNPTATTLELWQSAGFEAIFIVQNICKFYSPPSTFHH